MDIFNRKKIAELKEIIEGQERELKNFRKERDSKNSEKHKMGAWCEGCKTELFISLLAIILLNSVFLITSAKIGKNDYDRKIYSLPHLRRKNPDENQT